MDKVLDPVAVSPESSDSKKKLESAKSNIPVSKKIKKKAKVKLAAEETSDSEVEPSNNQDKPSIRKNPQSNSLVTKESTPIEKQQEEIKQLESKIRELKETNQAKKINVSFFYFDGFKTTKKATVTKGTKIGDFLELARKFICREYPEFSSIKGDHIFMLVVDEFIIPNEVNFFDLELKNINEKPGPCLEYARTEDGTEELKNPVLKIIDRRFYEQNKHIFPFSKWVHLPL